MAQVSAHRGPGREHGLLLRQSYTVSYSMFYAMIMFMWWNKRVWCKVYAPGQFADRAWDFMIMSGWTFPSPGGRWATCTLYNYLPGFVRYRNRHDRTWHGCEKYLKTEQTEHSQCNLQNWVYFRSHFLSLHFFSQCKKKFAIGTWTTVTFYFLNIFW